MAADAISMPTPSSTAGGTKSGAGQGYASLIVAGSLIATIILCFGLVCFGIRKTFSRGNGDLEAGVNANATQRLDKVAASRSYRQWKEETEHAAQLSQRTSNYLVCAICLEVLNDDDMVRHLPCGHVFHSSCLNKWFLKRHETCPLCKACYLRNHKQAAP